MASCLGSSVGSRSVEHSDDKERFFRICRLLLDGGTEVLRQEFDKRIPPSTLSSRLIREKTKLLKLPSRVLPISMFQRLYPTANTCGKSKDFDISLLMVLFRQLCGLTPPPSTGNWSEMPADSDESLEADILRLKIFRNNVFAHATFCCISEADFNQISKDICDIFERLDGLNWRLKAERMLGEALTGSENVYLKRLNEWHSLDADMKEIYQQLDCKMGHMLKLTERQENKIEQAVHQTKKIEAKVDQVSQDNQAIKEDIAKISSKLSPGTFILVVFGHTILNGHQSNSVRPMTPVQNRKKILDFSFKMLLVFETIIRLKIF